MTNRASVAESLLFLSVDLVGSTRFKQAGPKWPLAFLSFYREFPQKLAEVQQLYPDSKLQFRLWKAIGDELIFTTAVQHERQVKQAVRIWIETMGAYERATLGDERMLTKGGAFIATFPGPDSRVAIPLRPDTEVSDKGPVELNYAAFEEGQEGSYLFDYLGPSVDTGFRVISAGDPRHFTISVEVAWALCRGTYGAGDVPPQDLVLLPPRELKGVWEGRPYPILAVDRHRDDRVNAALSALQGPVHSFFEIEELCRACSEDSRWPSALYLPESEFELFNRLPEDALEPLRLNEMEGAETVPEAASDEGDELPADAPLWDIDHERLEELAEQYARDWSDAPDFDWPEPPEEPDFAPER